MASFRFQGRTARGESISGLQEADSPESLADHLFARGITPIEIVAANARSGDSVQELWRKLGGGKPNANDLIMFSRQMYALTNAGLPLLRGITSLVASTPNQQLREALGQVLENLQAGRDLATSLGRHPEIFSRFYVSVVRIGESTGTLPTAFMRMYEYLSMEKRIADKLKTAMRYPTTVLVAILVAVVVITMFVLPKFEPIFRALGDNLPWATRVLLGFSGFAASYWYVLLAGALTFAIGMHLYLRNPDGR